MIAVNSLPDNQARSEIALSKDPKDLREIKKKSSPTESFFPDPLYLDRSTPDAYAIVSHDIPLPTESMKSSDNLLQIAQETIENTLASLPDEIRSLAEALPLILEGRPSPEILDEEVDEDILGLFVGDSLEDLGESAAPMPGQILLFYENIWDFSEENIEIYKEEVRITFLHELGHYLGWDERDLFERDLE